LAYFRKIVAVLCLMAASGGSAPSGSGRLHALQAFPRVMLWAWESRQDLREISPEKYAVAYLAETVFITDRVEVVPRKQHLLVPENAKVMAVVRIEAPWSRARLDIPQLTQKVADELAHAARHNRVSSLQIDFDATKSQRSFYRELIKETRRRLPQEMPLSITALASWCSQNGWLQDLPVDEAVPMLFRMGKERGSLKNSAWNYQAAEPLCQTSVGVSTDEPWPAITQGQRIYIFHPGPWNSVALNNVEKFIAP
jgi:hypothetical protein